MIYQDLTTAALLGHAAQYHSETEIVSVSTGGEQERSSWEVASRAQRLASALASLGLPPGAAALPWHGTIAATWRSILPSPPALGDTTLSTRGCRLTICGISLNDAADEVLFFDQTFLPLVAQLLPQLRR
ncbi:hypothetical protein LNP25_19320 [Klebsiella variicola subsp. variicola]|nr:hypothetical protein [Klebsiella variicola subsp. variicola]